jgi:hypothetical protein
MVVGQLDDGHGDFAGRLEPRFTGSNFDTIMKSLTFVLKATVRVPHAPGSYEAFVELEGDGVEVCLAEV